MTDEKRASWNKVLAESDLGIDDCWYAVFDSIVKAAITAPSRTGIYSESPGTPYSDADEVFEGTMIVANRAIEYLKHLLELGNDWVTGSDGVKFKPNRLVFDSVYGELGLT